MISSGQLPRRTMNADTMTPAKVKDVLSCRERLGITQCSVPPGGSGSVGRVCIHPEEGMLPPLPRTVMIFPPAASDGIDAAADIRRLSPLSRRNISCAAFSEVNKLPDDLRKFSEVQRIPVFTSCYDASLLKSRLIGLIREKGGRQIMVHGVLIRLSGLGILITGDSGIGKTACSLELVSRGSQWVADDAVILERRGEVLCGRGHHRTRRLIAVRGRGILDVHQLLGVEAIRDETQVNVIIRFVRQTGTEGTTGAGDDEDSMHEFMGVPVPCRRFEAGNSTRRMSEQVLETAEAFLLAAENRRTIGGGKRRTHPAGGNRQ